MAVKDLIFLVKLQAWRIVTPTLMFFNDFRQKFHNTNFITVRKFARTAIFCKISQWLVLACFVLQI